MNITHIGIWTNDIERIKDFYIKWFGGYTNGERYVNQKKKFESLMINFKSGPQLEIMKRADITEKKYNADEQIGLAHFAFSASSKEEVDQKAAEMKNDGIKIIDGPRTTGDGYYEVAIYDPDDNRIEISYKS